MCQFCTKHGDGRKWYLEASNYASDLKSDLRRRRMVVQFVRDFDEQVGKALDGLERLKRWPRPLRNLALRLFSRRLQRDHFGQPVPIEDCEAIFDLTTTIVRVPCVCRNFAGSEDDGYCLGVSAVPPDLELLGEVFDDYAAGPDTSGLQQITKHEALELLRRCEEQGAMHSVWTFGTPFIGGLCNCDPAAGCLAMRLTREYDVKCMWKGEYVARVDPDLCTGCGQCVELCPFDAIELDAAGRKAMVRLEQCYGCGVCRAACSAEALSLAPRADVPAVARVW